MLPPLTFEPLLKRIRWGGRKLGTLLNKRIGPESDYAESWELADHAEGQSRVASGTLAGTTLASLIRSDPEKLLGRHSAATQFPLLIKFLDANDWLSLQVHPDDRLAGTYDSSENGKTEAWVILDAAPESRICAGLKPGITREQLKDALHSGEIESCLNLIPVRAGDCIYVPAGTVHALGPGIVLAEVQQQSNLTFRLHDWGRVDASGKPRPIHVEESLACTDFARGPVFPVKPVLLPGRTHVAEELVRSSYFVICRHQFSEPIRIVTDDRFRILISLRGDADVSTETGTAALPMGSTVLLPACSENAVVRPSGEAVVLEVFCP